MKTITIFAALLLLIGLSFTTFAQEPQTANTIKLSAGQASEPAKIADVAWLAGSWTGTGLGGVSQETWSRPENGEMLGTYRLLKDGKPIFYEMLWLREVNGTLIMRLKHFNPDLSGWEEKDKTVDFKFVKKDGKRLYFSGLTFELEAKNILNIFLALRQRDGTVKEDVFRMKRDANK